ncbi:MAG: hypothetical protein WCF49_10925, partial [Xanthobacteraceae bacterium]
TLLARADEAIEWATVLLAQADLSCHAALSREAMAGSASSTPCTSPKTRETLSPIRAESPFGNVHL